MSKERMKLTEWITGQLESLEELILSVKNRVDKVLARFEVAKKQIKMEIDAAKVDANAVKREVSDVKESVNIILDGLKK